MYGRTGEGGEREEKGTEGREGKVVQTTSTTAGIISAADTVGSNVLSVNSIYVPLLSLASRGVRKVQFS